MPAYRLSPEMRLLLSPRRRATQRPDPSEAGQPHGPTPDNLLDQDAAVRTQRNLNNPMPLGGNL